MRNGPELWAFVLANSGLFLISSVLAAASYVAYRQSDNQTSFLIATVGFVVVMVGGLVEPVYQLVVRGDMNISGTELLWLQTGEGLFIAGGLGLLFYGIIRHGSRTSETEERAFSFDPADADD